MAASACMHSVFTTPIAQTSRTSSLLVPSLRLPRQQKSGMQIRCLAEEGQTTPTPTPTPVSATPPPPTPTPSPPPKPKVSTKFGDVFAFSGPAPERINGRLAMIGFVAAIGAELAKGDDVVAQLANGGLPLFIGTSVLFTLASLIPLFKGVSVDSKSSGVMTSSAEMWNGRFAMLGLVALVFTEFVKGGALV